MVTLSAEERAIAGGTDGAAMAMRIVAEAARLMGAGRLLPIESAHIDGALYHGDSGTLFAEKLVAGGARVAVRATLNVGAIDLTGCSRNRLPPHEREMASRMMTAYRELGCEPTWTCAPYQAGHRPRFGAQVAWGESNAVAFCNSVLGARTNRYGDFLDIACAIAGRAPDYGLHRTEHRVATVLVDVSRLDPAFLSSDIAWPVLGSLYGRLIGDAIGVVAGVTSPPGDHPTTQSPRRGGPGDHPTTQSPRRGGPGEDALKAFGAAAASSGSVGLFHIAGVTPEAPDVATALNGVPPNARIIVTDAMVRESQQRLSTAAPADRIDAVAIGSPHLSLEEFDRLESLLRGRRVSVPIYACTGRHIVARLDAQGRRAALESQGVVLVADTCIVVTPILPPQPGAVLMTNSGKFAHYTPSNTGYAVLYAGLADCVESAVAGRPVIVRQP